MSVSSFEAVVENGAIQLPPEVQVPDRTKVYVVVPNSGESPRFLLASPRLADRSKWVDFQKQQVKRS